MRPMQMAYKKPIDGIIKAGLEFLTGNCRRDTGIRYVDGSLNSWRLLRLLEGKNNHPKNRILDAAINELGFEAVLKDISRDCENRDIGDYYRNVRPVIIECENWETYTGRRISYEVSMTMRNWNQPKKYHFDVFREWMESDSPHMCCSIYRCYKQMYRERLKKCHTKQDILNMFKNGKSYKMMVRAYMEYVIRERLNDERNRGRRA